jgi:hypothetical protein
MRIHSVSFETWLANHPPDHGARWCRELYPWGAFEKLDYAPAARNVIQPVAVGTERFLATVTDSFLGANGRWNFMIQLKSDARTVSEQWQHRQWNDVFQLVAAPDGTFVTLFTKKTDPSKELLRRFMAGGLERVEQSRCLPLSGMLFRSLISYAAEDIFGNLASNVNVVFTRRTDSFSPSKPIDRRASFEPFLSQGSNLWISYSYTEEKAHRLALTLAGACRRLVVVYCQPTFTKHHRCSDLTAQIVSLSEFLGMGSWSVRVRYLPQVRFLLNNLQLRDDPGLLSPEADLRARILGGNEREIEITTSNLREAKAGLGRVIATKGDAAYVLACANLLNAALNKKLRLYRGAQRLEKEVYSFKAHLCKSLEQIAEHAPQGTDMHVAPDDLILVRVNGIQFSFHAIPRTPSLRAYAALERNGLQEWSGIRLQPVASLVLAWARAILAEEGPVRT